MEFLNKFNIKIKNKELLETALTHSSYSNEHKGVNNYERLEYLGDAVLELVTSEYFYLYTDYKEGKMTKLRASYVCEKALATYAKELGIDKHIRLGHGQIHNLNDTIIADVFEAVIGAVYLDKGIEFARNFIEMIYQDDVKNFTLDEVKDYKSILQEAMQAEYRESVTYKIVFEKGPPHNRVFFAEVSFNGIVLGRGEGRSKKVAEQEAAKDALNKKAI